jgi:hypothetical protein
VVRKFPFTFDTAGILTGAALYTPTVGDILMDAWIEIDTAWDGTTPLGDFGMFTGGVTGWYGQTVSPVLMSSGDGLFGGYADIGLLSGVQASGLRSLVDALMGTSNDGGGFYSVSGAAVNATNPMMNGSRFLPAKFTAVDPIKVCVSQDGTTTGADPASTQGAAILYLVTVTPA